MHGRLAARERSRGRPVQPPWEWVAGAWDDLSWRRVGGVQSGVQSERNRAQLRATQTALEGRSAPGTPGSLRPGAGRSQVQILSPRSRKTPAKWQVLLRCDGSRTGSIRGRNSTGFDVVQTHHLGLARGREAPTPGRGAPSVRCTRPRTGWSQVEWLRVVVPEVACARRVRSGVRSECT